LVVVWTITDCKEGRYYFSKANEKKKKPYAKINDAVVKASVQVDTDHTRGINSLSFLVDRQ